MWESSSHQNSIIPLPEQLLGSLAEEKEDIDIDLV
jgi:hypothetical protein